VAFCVAAGVVAGPHRSFYLVPGTDGGDVGQGEEHKHGDKLWSGNIIYSVLISTYKTWTAYEFELSHDESLGSSRLRCVLLRSASAVAVRKGHRVRETYR